MTSPKARWPSEKAFAAWCRRVIARSAIDLARQRQHWGRETLPMDDRGIPHLDPLDHGATQAFDAVEWQILIHQVLDPTEICVIRQRYQAGVSQRATARRCAVSQATVSRVHRRALTKLRRALS